MTTPTQGDKHAALESYAAGPADTPLLQETIGANFERTASTYPDVEALVDVAGNRRWTYAELNTEIDCIARALMASGITRGDRVGIWAPNCPEWTIMQYATAKVGAILVAINPAYRTHELAYALRHSGTRFLVSATLFKTSDYRSMVGEVLSEVPDLTDSVMLGYWHDDERSRDAVDDDGWMHTGDLAVMRGDGYCTIVGRIKDMVIRGGENVYPREVEEFLHTHPDVDDVQVIGVPDDNYGEEICAWIKMRPGRRPLNADAVRAFSSGKLAHYKIPRYVHVVDEFPMTVTGKVRKVDMRAETVRLLGLGTRG